MKFIVAFVAIVAVAVALPVKPQVNDLAELEAVIAAINSPSTDPATAVLLEQQLAAIIAETSPISVGPAIVEPSPIVSGPAIIDFPLPDGGAVTADGLAIHPVGVIQPVQPSPVVIGEIPAGSTPLVQIIVNVNQAESAVVGPAPIVAPEHVIEGIIVPGPVNVVESPDVSHVIEPVQVVSPVLPTPVVVEPVQVVSPVIIEPVAIGTPELPAPVVEPVQIGAPIIPAPAVVLPETLN